MSSDRILVWGLSNNRAGTEHVIDTYCRASPFAKFDFLCYEAPVNYEHLFASGDNRYYVIQSKLSIQLPTRGPCAHLPKIISMNIR